MNAEELQLKALGLERCAEAMRDGSQQMISLALAIKSGDVGAFLLFKDAVERCKAKFDGYELAAGGLDLDELHAAMTGQSDAMRRPGESFAEFDLRRAAGIRRAQGDEIGAQRLTNELNQLKNQRG